MELADLVGIEFLDLSDVEEEDQIIIRSSLQTSDSSVQFPWTTQLHNGDSDDPFPALGARRRTPYTESTASKATDPKTAAPVANGEVQSAVPVANGEVQIAVPVANNEVQSAANGEVQSTVPVANGEIQTPAPAPVAKSWASLFNNKTNNVVSAPVNGAVSAPLCPVRQDFSDPQCMRMAEFLVQYSLEMKAIHYMPRGIVNRASYCYINAIVQALLACSPLCNLMNGLAKEVTENESHKSTPIINAVCRLMKQFKLMPPQTKKQFNQGVTNDNALELDDTLKVLSSIKTGWAEGRQEDAEEFLGFLLNRLSDEMLELKALVQQNKTLWGARKVERSPIKQIFGGRLRSKITREGEGSSDNVQPFLTLQLNIEDAHSVSDALQALVRKTRLEGMLSTRTNEEIAAWQEVLIEELPVVLVLHLKCFNFVVDGCNKVFSDIDIPTNLNLEPEMLSVRTESVKQRQYKLFAIVNHEGKDATKGHYFTDAFHGGFGRWLRYDDSTVKTVSLEQVLKAHGYRTPYLLFYRRADTLGAR